MELPKEVHITPRMYQKLTEKIAGKPEERILSFLMLRSLKQARYSEENAGHFALAAPTYTHFTSPIRRYPDLIVHRILKEVLRDSAERWEGGVPVGISLRTRNAGVTTVEERPFRAALAKESERASAPEGRSSLAQRVSAGTADKSIQVTEGRPNPEAHTAPEVSPTKRSHHTDAASPWSKRRERETPPLKEGPIPLEELHAIAEESSQSERRADDAERELMEWKKAKFMQDRIGEEFDGLIISVTKFGFFVELTDLFVEGLVPLSTLTDDRYTYHENTREIIGERTRKVYRLGQKVLVLVDRIDPVEKKIQFALIEEKPQKTQPRQRSKKRKR